MSFNTLNFEDCMVQALPMDEIAGIPCYAAISLSGETGFYGAALVWQYSENVTYGVRPFVWTPADGIIARHERDLKVYGEKAQYPTWAGQNWLDMIVTADQLSVPYQHTAQWLDECRTKFNLCGVAVDPYLVKGLERALHLRDIETTRIPGMPEALLVAPHPQGFIDPQLPSGRIPLAMNRSIATLTHLCKLRYIALEYHPFLKWNWETAILVEDTAGNERFVEGDSNSPINPIIAVTMAVGLASALIDLKGDQYIQQWFETGRGKGKSRVPEGIAPPSQKEIEDTIKTLQDYDLQVVEIKDKPGHYLVGFDDNGVAEVVAHQLPMLYLGLRFGHDGAARRLARLVNPTLTELASQG